MECTQVLFSESYEEVNSTNERLPVATLEIEGIFYTIFNSENTIGRDESCDIKINNSAISSRHAVIEADDPDTHLLYDVGSTNKTKLGKTILKPHVRYRINDGDTITFGNISASYNISRQQPATPEKVSLVSIPETPEKDEAHPDVISDSSPEEKKNIDSLHDTSDLDMFDEKECDTSSVQQEVVGSTIEHKGSVKSNNIYEMDTLNFDSGEITTSFAYDEHINTDPSSSSRNNFVDNKTHFAANAGRDSQNAEESIYEICTQKSDMPDDVLEVCDSTVKGIDFDKHNMEATSSVNEEKGNKKSTDDDLIINEKDAEKTVAGEAEPSKLGSEEQNINDLDIYEIHTQKSIVDESKVNNTGSVLPNEDSKDNRLEWDDFPDVGSLVGTIADNLVCANPNEVEENKTASGIEAVVVGNSDLEKPNEEAFQDFYEAATQSAVRFNEQSAGEIKINLEKRNEPSHSVQANSISVKQKLAFEGDISLPASQNIDMFETDEKNDFVDGGIMKHFNDSDDESISNLANQLFPTEAGKFNENGQTLNKDTSDSFLFESATQPNERDQVIKANISVSEIDETFSSSLFEAAIQPRVDKEVIKGDASISKIDETFSSSTLETATDPKNISKVSHSKSKVNESFSSSFFEAVTQPVETVKDNKASDLLKKVEADIPPSDAQRVVINDENVTVSNIKETDTHTTVDKDIKVHSPVSKVNETFSCSLFEVASQPVEVNNIVKDSDFTNKVKTVFEANIEPAEAEKAIISGNASKNNIEETSPPQPILDENIISESKVNESFSSSFFEAATQPVEVEQCYKASGLNNVKTSFEADIRLAEAKKVINTECASVSNIEETLPPQPILDENIISESKVNESFSSSFFEAATQPVEVEQCYKPSGLNNVQTSFEADIRPAEAKKAIISESASVSNIEETLPTRPIVEESIISESKVNESFSSSFFEAATQPVEVEQCYKASGLNNVQTSFEADIRPAEAKKAIISESASVSNIEETLPTRPIVEESIISESKVNESFSSSFFEAATQPVEVEQRYKASGLNNVKTSSEADIQPAEAEKVINKESVSVSKVNETFSSNSFEADSQPNVAKEVIKDSTSENKAEDSFSPDFLEAAIQPVEGRKCDEANDLMKKVETSFESHIQPEAEAENVINNGSALITNVKKTLPHTLIETDTHPTVDEEIIKVNSPVSKVKETFSSSFFEAATQPAVVGNTNSEANNPSENKSSSLTPDILQEIKEASEIFMEDEEIPLNDNFFEDATQHLLYNENADVGEQILKKKEKIMCVKTGIETSNGTLNFGETDLKQLAEDSIMTQGFYEAATQPVVENYTGPDTNTKSIGMDLEDCKTLKLFPFESSEPSSLNRDDLNISSSENFHEMATQPFIERDDATSKETILSRNDNSEKNVMESETSAAISKENIEASKTKENLISNRYSNESSTISLKITEQVDDIGSTNFPPTLDVLDEDFFEAATQPCPQRDMNHCSNQTEATKVTGDSTVCKEVQMELSESILPRAGHAKDDKVGKMLPLDDTAFNPDPIKVLEVNDTNRANVDMSLSCVNIHEIPTQEPSKNDELSNSKKNVNPVRDNMIVTISKVQNNTKVHATSDLLKIIKILQGDDENSMSPSEHNEENTDSKNDDISESKKSNLTETEKTKKSLGVQKHVNSLHLNSRTTLACKDKRQRKEQFNDEGSQDDSPLVLTRKKGRKAIISDDSEQSSEECIIKFKKKGCNVFPPDTQESVNSEEDMSIPIDTGKGKLKKQKSKGRTNNTGGSTTQVAVSDSGSPDSQQSSEEPVIKFKRKNANIFPSDSDQFTSSFDVQNECNRKENSSPLELEKKEESLKSCLNTMNMSPKKTKSSSERDQSYISRGNITLHSQEVLEELEEQFRLVENAMSPTQLSVVSESNDELLINECNSPVVRRSERKKSEKILYKPLANKSNNADINVEQKKASSATASKLEKNNGNQINDKEQSTNKNEKSSDETNNHDSVKSVKKFQKSTPTKDKPLNKKKKSSNENLNPIKNVLENIKKESLDSNDSQSSMSNSENELGRGKRKRTKTSFDDFVLEEDFKKLGKKSSDTILVHDSKINKSGSHDSKIQNDYSLSNSSQELVKQTQKLSVVLHDINKNSTSSSKMATPESSTSSEKKSNLIENYEDDLILPPQKTSVYKPKVDGKKENNTSKILGSNKTINESSANKSNTMSFCEKLDELFNIWGPADRVKLSPRAPKKTLKVLENEANSVKNKAKKSAEISRTKTSPPCNTSTPEKSSISKPSSSRSLFLKHKITEETSNGPVKKKSKKNRTNSQSDSVCSESSDSSSITTRRTSGRSNASPLERTDENTNRKRSLQETSKPVDVETLQSDNNSKKKCSSGSRNNSQAVNKKSTIASQLITRRNNKNINQQKENRKNNNISVTANAMQSDDHYIMSQEFSFCARNESNKTPMKEEFKPPQLIVRRSARSRQESKADKKDRHKVLFTGLSDTKFKALVTELGGEVVDSPFTCTVLVTDTVKRTAKFLSALARGIPIVTSQWLSESSGSFEDTDRFIVNDTKAETSYSFSLKESISKAKDKKLLDGWSVFITHSVPKSEDLKSMVECSGGRCLSRGPARWPPNSLVISCEKDNGLWNRLTKRGKRPPVVSTEALFSGILQQNLKIEEYRLI